MLENKFKVVNGATFERVPSTRGCTGCVGSLGDIKNFNLECELLNESGCSFTYIFKSGKDEESYNNVNPPATVVQGVKYDSDKLQYSLIPPYALEAVAQNLTDGLKKYPERNNWLKVDNAQERYMDALYRHLEAHRKGEIYDTDNINPKNTHMAAVVANAMFLLEFMLDPKLKGNK